MIIKAKHRIQAFDGKKIKTIITAGKLYRAEQKKWLYYVRMTRAEFPCTARTISGGCLPPLTMVQQHNSITEGIR